MEEELREETVDHEDEEDELDGGAQDLRGGGGESERGDKGVVRVEAEAKEEGNGAERELTEHGSGERDGFAAKAEPGFDDLLPGVDVVLVLAREELAHLGVDAVDISGEEEHCEEDRHGERVDGGHALAAFRIAGWGGTVTRSMRVAGSLNR